MNKKSLKLFALLPLFLLSGINSYAQINHDTNQNLSRNQNNDSSSLLADRDVIVYEIDNNTGNGDMGDFGTYPLNGPYNLDAIGTNLPIGRILSGDADGNGNIYAITSPQADGEVDELLSIDRFTGQSTTIGPLNISVDQITTGISWDPTTSIMYVISGDVNDATLYTVNLSTGVLTSVGSLGGSFFTWLVIDNDGVLYAASLFDELYTVDKTTGLATLVGPFTISGTSDVLNINNIQDADVDPTTNQLYMAANVSGTNNNNAVYTVNKTTGEVTFVDTLNETIVPLFVINPAIDNATCEAALDIPIGITNTDGIINTDEGASNTCLSGANNALWFSYTAANSGALTISSDLASNGTIDTRLSVYSGDCSVLSCIASDDNSGTGNSSSLVINVTVGATYLIEWDDANDTIAFDFELSLDISCPDPQNFTASIINDEDVIFTWTDAPEATNGYTLEVFNQFDNPDTATPIFQGTVPSGSTTATAVGLEGNTNYDAYLTANCGTTNGDSNRVITSFKTEVRSPNCGDAFFDTGGPDGNFSDLEDYTLLIENDNPNGLISLVFTEVDIDNDFDTALLIYDGDDTSAPLLTTTEGVLVSDIFTSNTLGGNLTIRFVSDFAGASEGWRAYVLCEEPNACETPTDFTAIERSQNDATFSWSQPTAGSTITQYELEVFLPEQNPNTDVPVFAGAVASTESEIQATGLELNTTYAAYLRTVCAGDTSTTNYIPFTTFPVVPVCGDIFTDTGGATENYMNDENYFLLIENQDDDILTIEFTSVSIENVDFLRIYDGDNATATQLTGDGGVQPGGQTVFESTPGGNLFVTFMSDEVLNLNGWEATVSCDAALSTEDFQVNAPSIYPNPSSDMVFLENTHTITSVEIYTLSGQKVLEKDLNNTEGLVDMSSFSVGVYLMKVYTNDKVYIEKVIKQ